MNSSLMMLGLLFAAVLPAESVTTIDADGLDVALTGNTAKKPAKPAPSAPTKEAQKREKPKDARPARPAHLFL